MNQNTIKIDQNQPMIYKNMITIWKIRIVKGKKSIKLKFKNLKA